MLKVDVIWGIVFNLNGMLLLILFRNLILCEWTCLSHFLFLFLNLWGIHWSVWLGYRLTLCYWSSVDVISCLLNFVSCTSYNTHVSRWRSENIGPFEPILCCWGPFNAVRQEMIDAIDIWTAFLTSQSGPGISLINTYQTLVFQYFK